jgi:hypothetical protein
VLVRPANPLLSFEGIGPRASVLLGQGPCGPRTPGRPGPPIFEVIETAANWAGPRRWAYSSVGLEHTPDKREVGSSNLPRPTIRRRAETLRSPHLGSAGRTLTWGCSSAGRAAALQAVGRRFDSGQLHQLLVNRPVEWGVIDSWSFDDSSAARMRKLLPGHIPSRGFLIRE